MEAVTSEVLQALAARYERSQAGRTGQSTQDLLVDYEALLREAHCGGGDGRVCAERDLKDAEPDLLQIERHRRTRLPLRIRFSPSREAALYHKLGQPSPTESRQALAGLFLHALEHFAPDLGTWQAAWETFCCRLAEAAAIGQSIAPFQRRSPEEITECLQLLPQLLTWESESLRRFASSRLCRDSKRLDALQSTLEACLDVITGGCLRSLEDLGILENERAVIVHGPLCLHFPEGQLDLGLLSAPARIDRRDLRRARFVTAATRCLTVENLSVLHELAKSRPGTLLASSGSEGGFAHSAIIEFLQALPESVTCWHCGDSDPKGFEILHNLRERVGRPIASLGMDFDSSRSGPPLNAAERKTITRLLGSSRMSDPEKSALLAMQAANHKGVFEQEERVLPE